MVNLAPRRKICALAGFQVLFVSHVQLARSNTITATVYANHVRINLLTHTTIQLRKALLSAVSNVRMDLNQLT